MIEFEDVAGPTPPAPPDVGYSPQLRTALVLTGTGTAGAYHAGVLRALHESGVKIDIVAGRGIGAVGALFAAVDGSQRLWDEKGFWRARTVESFYPWRASLRVFAWALGVAAAAFVLPLLLIAAGLAVFPVDFLLRLAGLGGAASLVDGYLRLTQGAFAAERLPTWVPRVVTLAVIVAGVVAAVSLWTRSRASRRGAPWWRVVGSPLSSAAVHAHCWRVMWDLVRGAAPLKQPTAHDLARRYVELLAENIGQPGFRELLLTVHDLDARRDLVFAVVAESRRAALVKGNEERRSEVFDLGGLARDHLVDVLCGALSVPLATEPHPVQFAAESYWRGETHRVCDRPAALARVLEELGTLGAEQVIIVSSAAESPGPHALVRRRLDARGRLGEYLQSSDVASVRDASHSTAGIRRLFVIRPGHNPIGPFDFAGSYDDRSDRRQPLAELIRNGYEDAYRQFIEPVVGASGEGVAQGAAS